MAQSQGISSKGQSPDACKGFRPRFLTLGPTLVTYCRREMLTTDSSLTGWGAVLDDRPAQGIWRGHLLNWHINCLRMMAVFRALKYILQQGLPRPSVGGKAVVVTYISHQGRLHLHRLIRLVQQVLLWTRGKFLSIMEIYILEYMNEKFSKWR